MYSWKDRIRDWVMMRGPLTHIGLAIGCTLVIVVIILAAAMPGKGTVNALTTDIGQVKTTMGVLSDGLGTKVSHEALNSSIQVIDEQLILLHNQADGLSDKLDDPDTGLDVIWTNMGELQYQMAEALNSPLEASLAGPFGGYILEARSESPGNFTANVHLVYSPAVGSAANATAAIGYFYAGVNWSVNATMPQYVPVATFDGTTWGISQVWWNVGVFPLVSGNVTMLDITCAGLNSTWAPGFAYVEVYQTE